MRDRSLLCSLILAGGIHFAVLFCSLPAVSLRADVPPMLEVTLAPAPARASCAAEPQKKTPEPAVRTKQESVRPAKPVAEIPPKKPKPSLEPEPVPAPEPEPEVVEVPEPEPQQVSDEIEQVGEFAVSSASADGGVDALAAGEYPAVGTATGDAASVSPFFLGDGAGYDSAPAYSHNPKPKYPRAARQAGQEGAAILRVEALSSGKVGRMIVEKSTGYELLDREAVEAVKRWRFKPAQKGAQPITAWVRIPIEFDLREAR
jgi:protein TonB